MSARKITLAAAAAALATAVPAHAQMNMPGMHMPGMNMPKSNKKASAKKTAPAKKGSGTKKAAKTAKKASAEKPAAKSHAKQGEGTMPAMEMKPGETMENMPGMTTPQGQSMPGMTMPQGQGMANMPGMTMGPDSDSEAAGTNLPAGNAPPPPIPSDHAADRSFPPEIMARTRHQFDREQGGQDFAKVMVNLAEYQAHKGRDGYEWNGEAWYGGDINRLWLKSEGDGTFGKGVERAEAQALYSRAIGPYFNLQGGLRYDFKPNPSRAYATLGVEGLAPGMFDVEGALFLSNKGELMARGEAWYDQRLTQRLILQPRAELNFAAQNSPSIGIGSGLSDAEIGLRLRYEIRREFAPYIGVQYKSAFGNTRRYLRQAGEDPAGWSLLAGIRAWL
jgi:copper resistance protein B